MPKDPKPVLVLVMLNCDDGQFATFKTNMDAKKRRKLPQVTAESEAISEQGINIRGLKIVLPKHSARNLIKKHPNIVLGVSYIRAVTTDFDGQVFSLTRERPSLPDESHAFDTAQPPPWYLTAMNVNNPASGGSGVNVYVMDTGVNVDHKEFRGINFGAPNTHFDGDLPDVKDTNGHGTELTSVIVGRNLGVARGATVIPVRFYSGQVKLQGGGIVETTGLNMFTSLLWILAHVQRNRKQGKAVVNFSQGPATSYAIKTIQNLTTHPPTEDEIKRSDPWYHMLPIFRDNDIIVVTSAGNDNYINNGNPENEKEAITGQSPRCYAAPPDDGGRRPDNLVVIGGSNKQGKRWVRQEPGGSAAGKKPQVGSNEFTSIIDAYAPAEMDQLASFQNNSGYVKDAGTSLSAAVASGVIATYLGTVRDVRRGTAGEVVKEYIRRAARTGTGAGQSTSSGGGTDNVPVLQVI